VKHGNTKRVALFKFERNIGTEALKYCSLSCPKFPGEQEFAKVRSTKCSKLFDEGKSCRTAGENGSNVMAMERTFTHIGPFKQKYWNIRFSKLVVYNSETSFICWNRTVSGSMIRHVAIHGTEVIKDNCKSFTLLTN
jgi:hypothetical protein